MERRASSPVHPEPKEAQSRFQMALKKQIDYARKIVPSATWRALASPVRGPVHLIFALADHFEPAIDPEDGQKRVPRSEQERRLDWWTRGYPTVVDGSC